MKDIATYSLLLYGGLTLNDPTSAESEFTPSKDVQLINFQITNITASMGQSIVQSHNTAQLPQNGGKLALKGTDYFLDNSVLWKSQPAFVASFIAVGRHGIYNVTVN